MWNVKHGQKGTHAFTNHALTFKWNTCLSLHVERMEGKISLTLSLPEFCWLKPLFSPEAAKSWVLVCIKSERKCEAPSPMGYFWYLGTLTGGALENFAERRGSILWAMGSEG